MCEALDEVLMDHGRCGITPVGHDTPFSSSGAVTTSEVASGTGPACSRQMPDCGNGDEFVGDAGPETQVVLGRDPRRGGVELERG